MFSFKLFGCKADKNKHRRQCAFKVIKINEVQMLGPEKYHFFQQNRTPDVFANMIRNYQMRVM